MKMPSTAVSGDGESLLEPGESGAVLAALHANLVAFYGESLEPGESGEVLAALRANLVFAEDGESLSQVRAARYLQPSAPISLLLSMVRVVWSPVIVRAASCQSC